MLENNHQTKHSATQLHGHPEGCKQTVPEELLLGMVDDKYSEHAPFRSTRSQSPPFTTPAFGSWMMDRNTYINLLKKYDTPVASGASTVCATLSVTPLDNVKTRMQTHNFPSAFQCARYIWRNEGPRGFFAGSLPPLITVTTVRVANFWTYKAFKPIISDAIEKVTGKSPLEIYDTPGSVPTVSSMTTFAAAGMLAGLVSTPLACPFELAKNVVQTSVLLSSRATASSDGAVDPSLRHKPRLNTFGAMKQIVIRHGIGGLYTAFSLHAMRDMIGTGMYFSVYETVKQLTSKELGQTQAPFAGPMIAGGICSTVPWLCMYPLDTRKTRAQSILLGKTDEVGEASKAVSKSSMYKGLPILLVRTGINNMILLSLYEFFKMRIDQLEA